LFTLLKKYRNIAVLVLMLSTFSLCYAQFSANVQGTVSNTKGDVVAGADVTLTNTATGVTQVHTTDGAGIYRFDSILPGPYTVTVEAPGFDKVVMGRDVAAEETVGVNVVLQVGKFSTTVHVSSQNAGINPDETRLQYTIGSKDLDRIPLPDRSTITALRLAPGTVGTIETTGGTNTNIPIGQPTPDVRGNGRPATSNLYLLDRIPITSTTSTGALNLVPNPDMLAEIALQTTTFSVENGAASSLQVELTSKSGANKFHGDFDISYTSKPFEANPDFSAGVEPFHRKNFMASLGGPIIKNHTFFFGSWEKVDNLSATGSETQAWTPEFGQYAAATFPNSPFAKIFNFAPSRLVNTTTLFTAGQAYPYSATNGTGCGVAPYFMPCSLKMILHGSFNQNPYLKGQQYNFRVDHTIRQGKDRFYGMFFRTDQQSQYLDPRPAFDTLTPSETWYASAGYTHVFTQNILNQFNAGLNRYYSGAALNPNYAIFPHATLFCFTCSGGFFFAGGPQMGPDSSYVGGSNKEHVFALRDYVSWLKGRHSFRFGFQAQHIDYWQDSASNYSRPYNTYFSDILEMLQGKADEESLYTISATTGKWIGQYYGAQEWQFGGYVQDDWKIKRNLLLSLGLRWDDFGNPSNYGDDTSPYADTLLGPGATLQDQVAGAYNTLVSHAYSARQSKNFLPRAAFSWAPTADQKMTIRGGVGWYQDAISLSNITANLPTTTPVRLTLTLDDAAEPNGNFFCGFFCGPWHPWTGVSAVPGEPNPVALVGTQGITPPYGFPYPTIPVTGFTSRGLATGPNGLVYQSDAYGVDPKLKPQSTAIWNLGLEQEAAGNIVFGLLYSGSHSYNQFLNSNAFDNPPGGAPRPWTGVGKVALIQNKLESNYSALIATIRQRKGNFNWQASYLWSHSLGNPLSPDNPNPYTARAFYGTTNLDVRNRFTLSGYYEVPRMGTNAIVRAATGGWTAGTIVIAQAGTPFTVYTSNDLNQDSNKDAANDRPSVIPGSTHYGGFSRAAFKRTGGIFSGACDAGAGSPGCPFYNPTTAQLDPNTFEGNEPQNAFNNPGYFDVDINVEKRTQLPWFFDEKSTFILRVEALNALNRANLNGFGSSIIVGTTIPFGQVQSAENPRIIQLGGRFEF
jgi:hypothetical protein